MQSFKELELNVIRWSEARKIIPNSTPVAQSRKTIEEAAEMLDAAAGLRALDRLREKYPSIAVAGGPFVELREELIEELEDGIGDVLVTLINVCALADVDLTKCLSLVYDEIKDRKGTLLPSGVFLKHEASNT